MTQGYIPGLEGAELRRDLSQFYTPDWLAKRLAEWMLPPGSKPVRVLEPSAGRGALVRKLIAAGALMRALQAFEADPENVRALQSLYGLYELTLPRCSYMVHEGDFLANWPMERFDVCVMNPPFEDGKDVAFASKALGCSDRVGGVFATRVLHSKGRAEFWRWTDIRRMAVLSERPQFGGDQSPKTDFVVLELARRERARRQGEASAGAIEWW